MSLFGSDLIFSDLTDDGLWIIFFWVEAFSVGS